MLQQIENINALNELLRNDLSKLVELMGLGKLETWSGSCDRRAFIGSPEALNRWPRP